MEGVISPSVCALSRSVEGKGEKRDLIESRVQFPEGGGRTHPSSTSLSLGLGGGGGGGRRLLSTLPSYKPVRSEGRGKKDVCSFLPPPLPP